MLRDARSLPDDGLDAHICIVGGGAAGITLALELERRGVDSVLLEAGADSPAVDAEAFTGTAIGRSYPLEATRLRGFGGTTGHWTGVCRPLDPVDFQPRAWIDGSGWPISADELSPYYERAQQILELGPWDYDVDRWCAAGDVNPPDPIAGFERVVFQYSPPTRFHDTYRDEVDRSAHIGCVTGATVVSVDVGPDYGAQGVTVLDTSSRTLRVRSRNVVMAAGAIETARLLLASDGVVPSGLGNQRDLVGRYFGEHPIVWTVPLLRTTGLDRLKFYGVNAAPHDSRTVRWRGHLSIEPHVRAQHELLGSYVALSLPGIAGLGAMSAEPDRQAVPDLAGLINPNARWDREQDPEGALAERVGHASIVLEQAPNPSSRVTVDKRDRDRFGLPKAMVEWRLSDLDEHSLDVTITRLARELGAAGLGRLRSAAMDARSWLEGAGPASHHLGTARMGTDPSTSVVDANGLVHGAQGLWVAGGATFPTVGSANPTLTIVALAVRLAEHLAAVAR